MYSWHIHLYVWLDLFCSLCVSLAVLVCLTEESLHFLFWERGHTRDISQSSTVQSKVLRLLQILLHTVVRRHRARHEDGNNEVSFLGNQIFSEILFDVCNLFLIRPGHGLCYRNVVFKQHCASFLNGHVHIGFPRSTFKCSREEVCRT